MKSCYFHKTFHIICLYNPLLPIYLTADDETCCLETSCSFQVKSFCLCLQCLCLETTHHLQQFYLTIQQLCLFNWYVTENITLNRKKRTLSYVFCNDSSIEISCYFTICHNSCAILWYLLTISSYFVLMNLWTIKSNIIILQICSYQNVKLQKYFYYQNIYEIYANLYSAIKL